MSYCTWDLETTIKASFKRKANPFDPDNHIVMSGYKRKDGVPEADLFSRAFKKPNDWFTKLLEGTSLLVGFNIKFDLLYALREEHNYAAWQEYVARGGNVWDCQLAEYLLQGMPQETHMLSMEEVAPLYGGNLKFDEVKALWAAGVDTYEINPDLLRRYLIGTDTEHGDIGNTELIFLGQLKKARAVGQVKSILLNMGSLLCTTEMERNGMKVDVELGLTLAEELKQHLTELEASLNLYLPKDLPFEFSWTSRVQQSALIFGGSVKYSARVAVLSESGELQYPQTEEVHYLLEDGGTIKASDDLDKAWVSLNVQVFKAGKNAGTPKTKKVKVPNKTDGPKMRNEDRYFAFPGYTAPDKKWLSSTPGVYSVAAEVIEELGERNIPFLKTLASVAKLRKDLGTYYITTDEKTGKQKGMLTLVQPDGLIHHGLNHTSTVTARFSSSNPNLQNIPKEGKSKVKTVFVSRFGTEGQICQSDFSALEVYIQAILTKCKQLIADLVAGLDMHCVRVAQKEGRDYDEVLRLCKGYTNSEGERVDAIPEWDTKRTKAKVFSFQRAYGAGAAKIASSTGMPQDEVEALITAEDTRYPEIATYYETITADIKESRVPTARFAQHPDLPGQTCQFGRGWFRTPDNKLYCYQEGATPLFLAKRGQLVGFSPTEIKNYVVQGEGGEWAKAAMWLAVRAFYKRKNFGSLALLVNQVHDALYGDFHKTVSIEAAALLHACMEAASDFMEYYFAWEIPCPVPSDTVLGDNMMAEGTINDPLFKELAGKFRVELRTQFMGAYVPTFTRS